MYVHTFRRSFLVKISLKINAYRIVRSLFVSFFPRFSLLLHRSLFTLFTPCAILLSLFLPLPLLPFPLRALLPHSRSFLSLFKLFRELARCVHVHALCPLFPTVILFYENRRLLGRTEATTSLKVVLSIRHPSRFSLSISLSLSLFPFLVRFTLSLSFSQKVPRFFSLFPRPFLDPFLQEHSQSS